MKKLISLLLAVVMALTLVPATQILAADGPQIAEKDFTIEEHVGDRCYFNFTVDNCSGVDYFFYDANGTFVSKSEVANHITVSMNYQQVNSTTGTVDISFEADEWLNDKSVRIMFKGLSGTYQSYSETYNFSDIHDPKKYTTSKIHRATFTRNGYEANECSVCGQALEVIRMIPKVDTCKLTETKYVYDGTKKTPSVTLKDSCRYPLAKNTDYKLTYPTYRTKVGSYKVTVTLRGTDYFGTKELTYTIVPKSTTVSSVTASSKAFTVKWKKQATQTTGYQIQYSRKSNFTGSTTKKVTVKGTSSTTKKVTKLTGGRKYYVRIRTYKTVNGKNYYSSWSKARTVTTGK